MFDGCGWVFLESGQVLLFKSFQPQLLNSLLDRDDDSAAGSGNRWTADGGRWLAVAGLAPGGAETNGGGEDHGFIGHAHAA